MEPIRVVSKADIFRCWKVDLREPIPSWIYLNFDIKIKPSEMTPLGFTPTRLVIGGEIVCEGKYVISKDLKQIIVINEEMLKNLYEVIENESNNK